MSIILKALEKGQPPPSSEGAGAEAQPPGAAPTHSTLGLLQGLKSPPPSAPMSVSSPAARGGAAMVRAKSRFQSGVLVGALLVGAAAAGFFMFGEEDAPLDPNKPLSNLEAPAGDAASLRNSSAANPQEKTSPPDSAAPSQSALESPGSELAPAVQEEKPAPPTLQQTPMVVRVQVELNPGTGTGTGFVVAPQAPAPRAPREEDYDIPPPPKAVAKPAPPAEKYKLNGVSWSDTNPMAIINDEIVGIGQKVGDMTVKSISKDSVVIEGKGQRLELR